MIDLRDNGFANRLMRDPTAFGPLILDDAGTVAHVRFNGSALVDGKGNAWTQNGTVPQVARAGRTPPGAGSFSDANNYGFTSASIPSLYFTGDFSVCVVGVATSFVNLPVLFGNETFNTQGWVLAFNANATAFCRTGGGGSTVATTVNSAVSGGLFVLCGGKAGTNVLSKINLGALATTGAALYAAGTTAGYLGRYSSISYALTGTIYEAWASTTTPTDALFTSIMTRVKQRVGITAW